MKKQMQQQVVTYSINMNGRIYDPVLSSFLSPDNYVQDHTSQQSFNRYAYCMYNPLKYVDPSGYRYFGYDESAYYRMIEEIAQQVFHEWYSVYEIAVASVQLTIDMSGCLFGHGLDTHASGSGHHGAAGGGSPISYKEFVEKCHQLGIEPGEPIPQEKWTDEFIKQFQEVFFPDAPMEYVKKFVVENLDKEFYFNNDDNVGGRTISLTNKSNGRLTGNSNVYFNDDYVFVSPENLFYAMGHEFVHVSQYAELKGVERDIKSDSDFIMTLEYHANAWGLSVGRGINKAYDRFESEMIQCYSSRYHLDYTYFNWTYNISIWLHP